MSSNERLVELIKQYTVVMEHPPEPKVGRFSRFWDWWNSLSETDQHIWRVYTLTRPKTLGTTGELKPEYDYDTHCEKK